MSPRLIHSSMAAPSVEAPELFSLEEQRCRTRWSSHNGVPRAVCSSEVPERPFGKRQPSAYKVASRVLLHRTAAAAEITNAFWHACRGGQQLMAELLLQHGADRNWIGHDRKTPLDAAKESGAEDLIDWLLNHGARNSTTTLERRTR